MDWFIANYDARLGYWWQILHINKYDIANIGWKVTLIKRKIEYTMEF